MMISYSSTSDEVGCKVSQKYFYFYFVTMVYTCWWLVAGGIGMLWPGTGVGPVPVVTRATWHQWDTDSPPHQFVFITDSRYYIQHHIDT